LLGDVFMAQGDLAEALVSSQDSLATRDRLANTNPDSASSQHDLSISHIKIGDVLVAQGNYRLSLVIRRRHARLDPQWQRDLAVAHGKIASVLAQQGETLGALKAFRQARAIIVHGNAQLPRDLALFDAEISRLERGQRGQNKQLDRCPADQWEFGGR
jgi:hypothetical protein